MQAAMTRRCAAAAAVELEMTRAQMHPAVAGRTMAEEVAAAEAAVSEKQVAAAAASALCTGYGIHCWPPEMRLAPAQCKLDVEQAAGCMTLHPGMLWCLWAAGEQDHHMAASGLHCLTWMATV